MLSQRSCLSTFSLLHLYQNDKREINSGRINLVDAYTRLCHPCTHTHTDTHKQSNIYTSNYLMHSLSMKRRFHSRIFVYSTTAFSFFFSKISSVSRELFCQFSELKLFQVLGVNIVMHRIKKHFHEQQLISIHFFTSQPCLFLNESLLLSIDLKSTFSQH